jgi:hypothetical protein
MNEPMVSGLGVKKCEGRKEGRERGRERGRKAGKEERREGRREKKRIGFISMYIYSSAALRLWCCWPWWLRSHTFS